MEPTIFNMVFVMLVSFLVAFLNIVLPQPWVLVVLILWALFLVGDAFVFRGKLRKKYKRWMSDLRSNND